MEEEIEKALETYSFEDIMEYNDIEPEEVLQVLIEGGYIELPDATSV